MVRTVDETSHAHKRNAILGAVSTLVSTKGYEQMSVQDVLANVRISKGAFYHYFDSKPALLEALVEQITAELTDLCREVVDTPGSPSDEKLRRFFLTMTRRKAELRPVLLGTLNAWYSDSNAIVRQKLRTAALEELSPLLARVIRQGVDEGRFAAADPANTARIVWGLAQDLVDGLSGHLLSPGDHDPLPDMRAQIAAYSEGIERVLAMEDGTLRLIDDTVVADWVRAAREDTR